MLLTDTELTLIRGILRRGEARRRDRYGSVRVHVPVGNVLGAQIGTRTDGLLTARFDLPAGRHAEMTLEASVGAEAEQFVASVNAVDPEIRPS